ncbi:MAG: phage integrase N-terminal SAM-like domain-containing protein [Chitinophagaceae bacterium]|nr:phage integrase N-terminal SAM-like domain-containing protein [Chitinophagaceae bacterium]
MQIQRVDSVNGHVLKAMKDHLILKTYSASTIRTYLNEMQQLLHTVANIPVDALQPEHLKRYFACLYLPIYPKAEGISI